MKLLYVIYLYVSKYFFIVTSILKNSFIVEHFILIIFFHFILCNVNYFIYKYIKCCLLWKK